MVDCSNRECLATWHWPIVSMILRSACTKTQVPLFLWMQDVLQLAWYRCFSHRAYLKCFVDKLGQCHDLLRANIHGSVQTVSNECLDDADQAVYLSSNALGNLKQSI